MLLCLPMASLSADERAEKRPPASDVAVQDSVFLGMAAFDPEWLAKYYGYDWPSGHVSGKMQENISAEESGRQPASPQKTAASLADSYTLSLRANLLRWATLTPDLGLEWRITPSVGIAVNGSWTSWTWQDNGRRYALWEVAPEVRWYMGKEKRGYLGTIFKAGQFNYKFSATGRQGDLLGGGITGGYQLQLSDALSLDFNVAVGCLHADYEKYEVIDGVRVRARQGDEELVGSGQCGCHLGVEAVLVKGGKYEDNDRIYDNDSFPCAATHAGRLCQGHALRHAPSRHR